MDGAGPSAVVNPPGAGGPPSASLELPASVEHCSHNGSRAWWIYTWARDKPETKTRTPYVCGSWRCPVCAQHEAHVTFARMRAAMAPLDPRAWVFCVLTVDREGYFSGEPWPSAAHAFRALSGMGRRWLKRLRRRQDKLKWQDTGNRWVAVVEAHRSGWPHCNYLVHSPELAAELREDNAARVLAGETEQQARMMRGWLLDATIGAGWGQVSSAEGARDDGALASYVTKLSGEAEQAAGELAKLSQLPTMAPKRFRRLRSGPGFLPPRTSDPERTGTMLMRYHRRDGEPAASPIHKVAPEREADVQECCQLEADRLLTELNTEELYRRLWQSGQSEAAKRMRPIVSVAHAGRWIE